MLMEIWSTVVDRSHISEATILRQLKIWRGPLGPYSRPPWPSFPLALPGSLLRRRAAGAAAQARRPAG